MSTNANLNYPREFGVKSRLAQAFSGFSGTAREFREFFASKPKKDGGHQTYTPEDIRRLRMHVLGIDPSTTPSKPQLPVVIASHTSKGGVGKTTLATNLAVAFSLLGHKTLIIDTDPQGSASEMLGVDTAAEDIVHLGALMKEGKDNPASLVDVSKAVCSIYQGKMLDLIPADITLASSISWMDKVSLEDNAFSNFMTKHIDFFSQYEIVIVDTAPSTSRLTEIVLNAVEEEIITPVTTDGQSIKALRVLANILTDLNERRQGANLRPLIITNALRAQSSDAKLGLAKLRKEFQQFLYPDFIPSAPVFGRQFSLTEEAPKENLPAVERQPATVGAQAILELAKFLIHRFNIKLNGHENRI